jgi:predicted nucleic acid-binding protein
MVSGDKNHLLSLGTCRDIRILTATEYLREADIR